MTTDDRSLGLEAARGDAAAFASLLERHYDRIFGLAFRLTGQQAEAEDLTQDICAALPAKIRAYRGDAAFSTWLYRVVVNAAHDRRRRQNTHHRAARGWGDWEVNRQAANAEAAEAQKWLHRAVASLPETLRDTLALVLDDLNHAEAGAVLGISEGTVSWRVSEAKKHLRALREKETI